MGDVPAPGPLRWAAAGAGLALFAACTITVADSDLWGHLRFGLDALTTRTLPSVDPYSFTQDKPWVNHEWLSEVVMGVAYTAGGVAGLALLKGTLVAVGLLFVWRATRGADPTARILVFACAAFAALPVTRTLRPQLWSLVSLAFLCTVLLEGRETRRWWLPPLFTIWANSHGGWIVGLGILSVWSATEVAFDFRKAARRATQLAACVLATLATPYGWGLWAFLGTTVRMERAITEWQPLWNSPAPDWLPWIASVGVSVWALRRPMAERWQTASVLAMLAYASLNVVRIVPLFAVCTALLLSPAWRREWPAADRRPAGPSPQSDTWAAAMIVAVTVSVAAWIGTGSLRCIQITGERTPDTPAVHLLKTGEPGRVVTFFDWGQFALWHLGPAFKVSMDGRRETVYSDLRLDQHGAYLEGTADGFAVLAEWQPEYVWLPATSQATRAWLVQSGYRLDYDSPRSFVAVRPDLPPLGVPGGQLPTGQCFPG